MTEIIQQGENLKETANILDGKRGAIFDMDGTLVDSMWIWDAIDREYLARFGITPPEDLMAKIEGMTFQETAVYFRERFEIEDSLEKMMADWNEMAYEKYAHEVPLKDGAAELLALIEQRGMKIGIATSNSRELAEVSLKANGIFSEFDTIRTAGEVQKGKPEPDIYLSVMQEWGMDPADIIVFEDVPMGALAGKRAGMTVCGMEDASSEKRRELLKTIADYYARDFHEVIDGRAEKVR